MDDIIKKKDLSNVIEIVQRENPIENTDNDAIFHQANFDKFLENFKNRNIFAGASWNKHREEHYRNQQNRRKIVLKEIDQLDSKVN